MKPKKKREKKTTTKLNQIIFYVWDITYVQEREQGTQNSEAKITEHFPNLLLILNAKRQDSQQTQNKINI